MYIFFNFNLDLCNFDYIRYFLYFLNYRPIQLDLHYMERTWFTLM